MSDEKKKVSAWVDVSLVESLRQHGYNNLTEAIITGFKMIIEKEEKVAASDNSSKASDSSSKDVDMMEKEVLKHENTLLKEYNETLHKELEDFKSMHNNYMLQMQTLINQRALEPAPADKKKPFWKFW